jgi:hypothetical protein
MNESAHGVTGHHSGEPYDDKNDEDGPKHGVVLSVILIS